MIIFIILFVGFLLTWIFGTVFSLKLSKDMGILFELKEKCKKEVNGTVVSVRREKDSEINIKRVKATSYRGFITVKYEDDNNSVIIQEYPFFYVDEKIPNVGDKIKVLYNSLNSKEFILPSQHITKIVLESKNRKTVRRLKGSGIYLLIYAGVLLMILIFELIMYKI